LWGSIFCNRLSPTGALPCQFSVLRGLKDADGEKVALSGDSFASVSEAKRAAKLVKETAPDAVIED